METWFEQWTMAAAGALIILLLIVGTFIFFGSLIKIGGELRSIWSALDRQNKLTKELIDEMRKTREAFCTGQKPDTSDDDEAEKQTRIIQTTR